MYLIHRGCCIGSNIIFLQARGCQKRSHVKQKLILIFPKFSLVVATLALSSLLANRVLNTPLVGGGEMSLRTPLLCVVWSILSFDMTLGDL